MKLSAELRAVVVQRGSFRCEYCLLHEDDAGFPHEVDHIISRQHGGKTTADNLAYACLVCNRYKGSNIASVPLSGHLVPLFHPSQDLWSDYFRRNRAVLEPLNLAAEVTARLLQLNAAERVVRRSVLQQLQTIRYELLINAPCNRHVCCRSISILLLTSKRPQYRFPPSTPRILRPNP